MSTVFVYGTLRTGASNAFRMRGATSVGGATVKAQLYRVHDQFPGITLGGGTLIGEVFTGVSDAHLEELDIYEGCDAAMPEPERLYRRTTTTATLASGEQMEVLIWEYIRPVEESSRILSGDWLCM